MNNKGSEQSDSDGNPKTTPSETVIDEHQKNGHHGHPQHDHPRNTFHFTAKRLWQWVVRIYRRTIWDLSRTPIHQKIEIGLAGLVAAATIFYVVLTYGTLTTIKNSSESASRQTDKLIQAANIQACAAQKIANASDRSAAAAENFSSSADEINQNTKLDVEEFKRSSQQTVAASAQQFQTQLELMRQQFAAFEDSQAGRFVIEDFAETPTDDENFRKVQFRLVNRGNSVISRIGIMSEGSSSPRPDFQSVKLFMNRPTYPNPIGFDLGPGKDKLMEFQVGRRVSTTLRHMLTEFSEFFHVT
jgi:hypothetical protein